MSINSMTGFGKGELSSDQYNLTIEIKSVNNRYKDFRFKMGSIFNSLEIELKKTVMEYVSRGSVDIFINYRRTESAAKFLDIDPVKVKKYLKFIEETVGDSKVTLSASPVDFFRNDFYKDEDDTKLEELTALLIPTFEEALKKLVISRNDEGEKLGKKINEHIKKYTEFYIKLKPIKEQYKEQITERLKKRFDEKTKELSIDDQRFNQEVIYYLERYDIDEELDRIEIHLEKFHSILEDGGEVGRKIDFLIQELNRETNTIGSKSAHEDISSHVVEMKVQLEKIREQALNLE
jgi:uncharacterized protein (TIGR00255 family)